MAKSTKSDSIRTVTDRNVLAFVKHLHPGISFLFFAAAFLSGCSTHRHAVRETAPPSDTVLVQKTEKNSPIDSAEFNRIFTTGALRAMQGDYAGAIRYYSAALRAVPDHSPSFEGLARSYAGLERYDSALVFARLAVTNGHPDLEAHRLLAELWVQNGEFDSGAVQYEYIVAREPDDLQARFMIGRTWERRRPQRSIRHYEYIRDNLAEDFNTLVGLYQVHSEQGNYRGAASALQSLIGQNPEDPNLHDLHCGIWIDAGQYDSATQALELAELYLHRPELLEQFLEPELTMAELRLRTAYVLDSNLQRFAGMLVQLAVRHMQQFPRSTYQAGMVALRLEIDSSADLLLERAFISDNLSDIAWTEAARLYLKRHAPERMLKILATSGGRFGEDRAEVNFLLAQAYRMTGHADSSALYLERAVQVDPEYGEALQQLARMYVRKDELGQAVAGFEQAVSADPYNPELLDEYATTLAESGTLLDKAEELAERALGIEPENELFLTTRGRIALLQQDYQAAVEYLQQAVNAGGATAERLELLGDARQAVGDEGRALDAYRQALNVAGGDEQERRLRLQQKINEHEL